MQTSIDYQSEFPQVIKRKAVGPKGSRSLNEDGLDIVIPALRDRDVNLVSKAVLVTSVIILERNKLEQWLLQQWKQEKFLPAELAAFFFGESDSDFSDLLHKILKGKDLDADEAASAISYLWDRDIPEYQKGVFLIGERLKRESFEENMAFLQAMRQKVNTFRVNVPLLIDLADPYDGFRRYPVYTPFTAALLAAVGFSSYCHGAKRVAPKYGNTIHEILALAGKNPQKPAADVVMNIENEDIGWGYIDLPVYFPEMNDLLKLRKNIVKRPFLATLEKLLQPVRAEKSNFLVTGYVHSHYKKELSDLLRDRDSLDAAFIVKGLEGSTQVDFRKKSESVAVNSDRIFSITAETKTTEFPENEWKEADSTARYCVETGIAALKGKKNTARDILINQVVHITRGLFLLEPNEARSIAKKALDSGRAYHHWQNGCL